MRKLILCAALGAVAAPMPALADPPPWAPAHGRRAHDREARQYYRGQYYSGPVWQGSDGRVRCRRGNGTTGLILGGALGALLGRSLDGGRNHTLGTVAGAAGGALLGREVQRSRQTRNCYR